MTLKNLKYLSKYQNFDFTDNANKYVNCLHELTDNELFIGNISIDKSGTITIPNYLKHLKSLRLGEQAYDINGLPLERYLHRPLIVGKQDYDEYNKIMSNRVKQIRLGIKF